MTTGDAPAAHAPAAHSRGVGWWLRSAATVLVPLGIALGAARHNPPGVAVLVGLLALLGAIFLFHPDTLGWRLSLMGRMSAGPDTGPSHGWRVWARLFGLGLVLICAAGALLYPSAPDGRGSCTYGPEGTLVCTGGAQSDAVTGS